MTGTSPHVGRSTRAPCRTLLAPISACRSERSGKITVMQAGDTTRSRGMNKVRCFHSDPPERAAPDLPSRHEVLGVVVCVHVFGVGVYLPDDSAWGHVNPPAFARTADGSLEVPSIGAGCRW